MPKKLVLPPGTIVPNHIALVMDGNGRWARSRGLPENKGHEAGAKAVKKVMDAAREAGVHTLTIWGFSTENWKRPKLEVAKIHNIVKNTLRRELATAKRDGIRFHHIGRKDRLPSGLMRWIRKVEKETKHNTKYVLNLALDYGGQDEILRAVRQIVKNRIPADQIDEKLFSSYLDTADQPYPYPDLFIRTSGEQRTSGFLPWQTIYAEFYFEQDHLPDMTAEKLKMAILDYSRRRRRFGAKEKVKQFKFKPEVIAGLEFKWWRLKNIPEGTRFREYAVKHIKEQFGMSKELSGKAAKHFVQAVIDGEKCHWRKAAKHSLEFYKLIRDEVKLALEPKLAATLQVKFWREINEVKDAKVAGEVEDTARRLYSEVYRMSSHQASKMAHLRVLASIERNMARNGMGDHHWDNVEDYLEMYYKALKERVA